MFQKIKKYLTKLTDLKSQIKQLSSENEVLRFQIASEIAKNMSLSEQLSGNISKKMEARVENVELWNCPFQNQTRRRHKA